MTPSPLSADVIYGSPLTAGAKFPTPLHDRPRSLAERRPGTFLSQQTESAIDLQREKACELRTEAWFAPSNTTVPVLRMAHRKCKETKQQPGTAEPGNMLGCWFNSFHFLWAILSTSTVQCSTYITSYYRSLHKSKDNFKTLVDRTLCTISDMHWSTTSLVQWPQFCAAQTDFCRDRALPNLPHHPKGATVREKMTMCGEIIFFAHVDQWLHFIQFGLLS